MAKIMSEEGGLIGIFKMRGIPKEMPCSQVDSRKEKK